MQHHRATHRGSVHAGFPHVPRLLCVTEGHCRRRLDTGRDGKVMTQAVTQPPKEAVCSEWRRGLCCQVLSASLSRRVVSCLGTVTAGGVSTFLRIHESGGFGAFWESVAFHSLKRVSRKAVRDWTGTVQRRPNRSGKGVFKPLE